MKAFVQKLLSLARSLPWLLLGQWTRRSPTPLPESLAGKSILVIQFNALGDSLMSTPLLRELKRAFPSSRLEVLTREHTSAVFLTNPHCDSVHLIRGKQIWMNVRTWFSLRRRRFDVVIDCTGLIRSACYSRSLRASSSLGFSRKLSAGLFDLDIGRYYGSCVPYSETKHILHLLLKLVEKWIDVPHDTSMTFVVEPNARKFALDWFHKQGLKSERSIILHPGAKWPPKRWPAEHWVELSKLVLHSTAGYVPVFVGGSNDGPMIDRIQSEVGHGAKKLIGYEIQETAAVVQLSRAAVCNDSFIMHLAAALKNPVIALFGPVHPSRSQPGETRGKSFYAEIFCSPCEQYYSAKRCWRGLNFCMYQIGPREVFESLQAYLEN